MCNHLEHLVTVGKVLVTPCKAKFLPTCRVETFNVVNEMCNYTACENMHKLQKPCDNMLLLYMPYEVTKCVTTFNV